MKHEQVLMWFPVFIAGVVAALFLTGCAEGHKLCFSLQPITEARDVSGLTQQTNKDNHDSKQ